MEPSEADVSRESGETAARRSLAATAVLAALFVGGLFLPPLLPPDYGGWGQAVRRLYAPLCHQRPERSLHLLGAPAAVCARCAGAYLGGATGLLLAVAGLARLRRRRLAWLVVAGLPSAIDVGARLLGYPGVGGLLRATLAAPAGAVAGLLLAEGIGDAARMLRQRGTARPAHPIPERSGRTAWIAATAGERKR